MQRFAELYAAIDATTSTLAKLDALTAYFGAAEAADAAWAVYFLAGGKPRQLVPSRTMCELAAALAGIPDWLFDEWYDAVGDLAETVAHVLPSRLGRPTCRLRSGSRSACCRCAVCRNMSCASG